MRIGIDSHMAEKDGTGNCTYTQNLILNLAELDQKNQYFLLVTNSEHPFYERLKDRANFHVIPICGSPSWFRVFVSLWRATHRHKLDVLHVQYFAPFWHRGRLINTIHDISWVRFPQFFSLFERFLFKVLLPSSAARSDLLLTVSQLSKEDLVSLLHLPERKIRVTYNGISPKFYSNTLEDSEILARYGFKKPYLLYVGRIDPRKNLKRLIEAYSCFRRKYSLQPQLGIAGKIYFEPEALQDTIRSSNYSDAIHFCGFVKDEDLPAIYSGADAFVYVSEYEGFGLPPLEAMAAGAPVIASDISIFQETLGGAANLVDPQNVEKIADAIHEVLTNTAYKKDLIEKGKVQAKKFTWHQTALSTLQGYEEVVKTPS